MEVTFTKYVTESGSIEYWLRLWNTKINRKIYPVIRFYIDDIKMELLAVNNPDDKYIYIRHKHCMILVLYGIFYQDSLLYQKIP